MRLDDVFDGDAARPEHPDMWALVRSVMDLDAAMELGDQRDWFRLVEELVDSDSLTYMAGQRGMRLFGGPPQNEKQKIAAAMAAAAWIEGFVAGARFRREVEGK